MELDRHDVFAANDFLLSYIYALLFRSLPFVGVRLNSRYRLPVLARFETAGIARKEMLRRRRRCVAENRARLDRGESKCGEALRELNFAKGAVGRGDEVAGRRCCVAQQMDPSSDSRFK